MEKFAEKKKKFVFCAKIPMRWSDMDAFGHANNAVYLTYFEQSRVQWWDSLHLTLSSEIEGPIQYDSHITYLHPIVYPASLLVDMYVSTISEKSFVVEYEIFINENREKKFTVGSTKIVWFDYRAKKAKPLPEHLLSLFYKN